MKIRNHYKIPEIQSGYELDPGNGWFSVLMPITLTTINTNPSFELGTTGYTAVNSALARVSSYQRRGVYSMSVTPSSTALSGTYLALTTVTGSQYSCGLDLYAPGGGWFDLYFADSSGNRISRVASVRGANYWKRLWVNFSEYAGGSRRVYLVRRAGGNTQPFYVDGVNLLPTQYKVAYFDGDKKGFLAGTTPFYWNGTPHASTSTMILDSGNGGYEVNLLDLGLRVMAVVGLGMMQFANISTPISDGGARYQRSVPVERSFALVGTIMGNTLDEIQRARASLQAALTPQRTATMQELVLRYHRTDPCTGDETETLDIPCVFDSAGLAGSLTNNYQENIELPFKQYLPQIYADGQEGATLNFQTTVSDFAYIGYRDIDGSWHAMGTGMNDEIWKIVVAPNGNVYAGGSFTTAGGGGANRIAVWDGSSWAALGTGLNETVLDIAIAPDGTLYVAGVFTTAGGGAVNYIAKWDGANWSDLAGGADGFVRCLAIGPDGKLYAGGEFANIGGVAASRIAVWDGTNWAALGTGLTGDVGPYGHFATSVVLGPDQNLYVSGYFTTAGGNAAANIAKWDGTNWSALAGGLEHYANGMAFGPDGNLYIARTQGGSADDDILSYWNGSAWTAIGNGTDNSAYVVTFDRSGVLYAGGSFTILGHAMISSAGFYINGTWLPLDFNMVDMAGTGTAMAFDNAGRLYIGGNWTGSDMVSSGFTEVTSSGARSYPVITFTGPGKIYQIKNNTNGKAIFFYGLTLNAGENAILTTDPLFFSFISSFRGDLQNYIWEGSTEFYLSSGDNEINLFMDGTDANSAAEMYWTRVIEGIDGAVR